MLYWDNTTFAVHPSTSVPFRGLRSGRTALGYVATILSVIFPPPVRPKRSCEAAKSKDQREKNIKKLIHLQIT
jgi:hypothetical protein